MHHLRAKLTFYLLVRRLLITFANSLGPDEARRDVGPYLDPNCNAIFSEKKSKKIILKKKSADDKNHEKMHSMQRISTTVGFNRFYSSLALNFN